MTDLFERPKVSPACLSAWQISRLAIEEVCEAGHDAATHHLRECEHCRQRLERESAKLRAAAHERLPERLAPFQDAPRRSLAWLWKSAGMLAAATAVFVGVVLVPGRDQPATRTKGELPVSVAVMRGGVLLVAEAPVEKVGELRPGDRLRLRVRAAPAMWVILQGWENNKWTDYFAGSLPRDEWLPVGVGVTPDGRTRLRLIACPKRPKEGDVDALVSTRACAVRLLER